MMRRFMDNNVRWPIWVTGICVAGLFFALPVIPFVREVRNWPTIPAAERAQLMAEAMRIPASAMTRQTIGWGIASPDDLDDMYDLSEDAALQWLEKQADSPKSYISIGDTDIDSRTPLEFDRYIFWRGLQAAEYLRVKIDFDPQETESIEQLGEWVRTYAVIAKRLRLSDRWFDQEAADTAEIWLTAVLSQPQMKEYLDRDYARVAIDVISDQETRNASRRRAVLASWRDYESSRLRPGDIEDRDQFGGFFMRGWLDWYKEAKRNAILQPTLDTLVATAIRYIDIGSQGEDTHAIRRELHTLLTGSLIPFDAGPYADDRRASGSANEPTYYHENFTQPATQWFAPWEAAAMKLKTNQSRGH